MTLLLHRSDVGEDIRTPITLDCKRRRLSAVVKERIPLRRPCIVSVHRRGKPLQPSDETVRLRGQWAKTLIGPQDTIVITYLPLGGGSGGQKGNQSKAIGGAIAMIAVAVAAPYLVGLLGPTFAVGGSLTLVGKIAAAGIVAGAGYLISKATTPKANKETAAKETYGVSGGGNVPRAGDRIPVNYGRCWYQPDLSQPDYFQYVDGQDTDDQILYKRMTLGGGRYKVHTIRVGQALMWSETGGLKSPFTKAEIEFITPGSPSTLVPGAVYSSDNVTGTELPRIVPENDDNIEAEWMGPFPVTEPTIKTTRIQIDFSLPQGAYATHPSKSGQLPQNWGCKFEYAPIDEDGNVTGPYSVLHQEWHQWYPPTETAIRRTVLKDVPLGRYVVRGQNSAEKLHQDLEEAGVGGPNMIYWDGLRAHLFNEPTRPDVQEIAMKISAEAMGSTMSFSDVWVETTSILPTRNAQGAWSTQPTNKAVWCALDVLRNQKYGGAYDDSQIDLDTFQYYAGALSSNETFDGTIRGPVSVYEAASTILGVIRAEPILIGNTWSMTRDEPRQYQKHVISRRQIVKDSSGIEFNLDVSNGDSDVIVEYYVDGDQRRRGEVRATIGQETITPKRLNLFGVSSHAHATMLARWYAACAYYRRESKTFSTELTGRILGRNDPAMIESWFLNETQAAGVEDRNGYVLTLDIDFTLPPGAHLVLRDQRGSEWGPVAITAGGTRQVVVDAADATAVAQTTFRTFASLFAKPNRRQPMTALIGTLSSLSRPYIIRTAKPDVGNTVQISAVYDAPEVWSVLGEAVPPGPPIKSILLNEAELAPVLPWLKASVVQKAVAITLDWSVGRARGSNRYQVHIAYGAEGGEWLKPYDGPQTSGSIVVKFKKDDDPTLRVRARAFNGQGIPSAWVYTTTTLFKPVINSDSADVNFDFESLSAQVRKSIEDIADMGRKSLREAIKLLDDKVQKLAEAAFTQAATDYNRADLIKFGIEGRLGDAFVAIAEEVQARIDENIAVYDSITTQALRLDNAELGVSAQVAQLDRVKQAIEYSYDGVTAKSERLTAIQSKIDGGPGQLGLAQITEDLKTAVGLSSTGITATATKISDVSTTVNNQSFTISQVTQSVDGVKGKWGVAFSNKSGALGGISLDYIVKNDGTGQTRFGVNGDCVVTGTLSANALEANSLLIKGTANVDDLVIAGRNIQDFAVSRAAGEDSAGNEYNAYANITVRAPGGGTPSRILILASYRGGGSGNQASPGEVMRIYRKVNGSWAQIKQQACNWSKTGDTSYQLGLTTIMHVDQSAPVGLAEYRCGCDAPGVSLYVVEICK